MISDKVSSLFQLHVRIASFTGAIPYKWDPPTGKLISTPNCRLRFTLFCTSVLFYMEYLIITVITESSGPKSNIKQLPLAFGTLMVVIVFFIMEYNIAKHLDLIQNYVNSYFKFSNEFEGKTKQNGKN